MEDLKLISGLTKGDKRAFEELFQKYYSLLVVFANKMVKDMDSAKEIVQDTFVGFYEKREEIKIHTSLKAHLFQSVRNRSLNYLKRENTIRNHHQIIESESKDDVLNFNDTIEEVELEQKIYAAINSLPDKCQEIFRMSRFEGLTNQEIADHLTLSKRTVETQISKALRIIRERLTDYLGVVVVGIMLLYFLFN